MIDIVALIYLVMGIISIVYTGIHKEDGKGGILIGMFFVIGVWFAVQASIDGYKRGQVDALNGEYKYELQVKVKQDTTYKYLGD